MDWQSWHDAREWLSGPDAGSGAGVHRFRCEPRPLTEGVRMFTFVGSDALGNPDAD